MKMDKSSIEDLLRCQVCKEICKRGVSLKCCGTQACRACATKQLTQTRKCWNQACLSASTTDDLVNDETLRDAVTKFKGGQTIAESVLREIKERYKEPELEMVAVTKAGDATKTAAPTNIKPSSSTAKKPSPTTPNKPSPSTKSSPMGASKPATATSSSSPQKRKSDVGANQQEAKKAKVDNIKSVKVYFDAEVIYAKKDGRSNKYITQLCWRNSESNHTVFVPVFDDNSSKYLSEEYLAWANLRKASGFVSQQNKKYMFIHKNGSTTNCELLYAALLKFRTFLQGLGSSRKITLVMYSESVYKAVFSLIKVIPIYYKQIKEQISSYIFYDSFIRNSNNGEKYPKPIHILAGKLDKPTSCQEAVELLEKLVNQSDMEKLLKCQRVSVNDKLYLPLGKDGFRKVSSVHPRIDDEDDLAGIVSFNNPSVPAETPAAPKPLKSALKRPTVPPKDEAELEEIVIVEDNPTAETAYLSGIFKIFFNPILLRLFNISEGTKAVTLISSKYKGLSPSKVYWKDGDAFAIFFMAMRTSYTERFVTSDTSLLSSIPERTSLCEVKKEGLGLAMEESRPFAKIVKVDLVFTSDPNLPDPEQKTFKLTRNQPAVVLVELVPLKNASLKNQELKFTSTDLFVFIKSKQNCVTAITSMISPERRGNLAKVVLSSTKDLTLSLGEVVGTALLFQEENMQLLLLKAEQQAQRVKNMMNMTDITEIQSTSVEESKSVGSPQKLPCSNLDKTYLYSRVFNYVCVRLKTNGPLSSKKKFGKADVVLSDEFLSSLEYSKKSLKTLAEPMEVQVYWMNEVPYAFLQIVLPVHHEIESKLIDKIPNIATYTPKQLGEVETPPCLEMTVCVDFEEKGREITHNPSILKVYMKFTGREIPKKEVLKQLFCLKKMHNPKLKILNIVFKPKFKENLAPQKTQTNDMQAILIVYCPEGSVHLTPREVIADAFSLGTSMAANNDLLGFKSCGAKMLPKLEQKPENVSYEEDDLNNPESPQKSRMRRIEHMKARARELQNQGREMLLENDRLRGRFSDPSDMIKRDIDMRPGRSTAEAVQQRLPAMMREDDDYLSQRMGQSDPMMDLRGGNIWLASARDQLSSGLQMSEVDLEAHRLRLMREEELLYQERMRQLQEETMMLRDNLWQGSSRGQAVLGDPSGMRSDFLADYQNVVNRRLDDSRKPGMDDFGRGGVESVPSQMSSRYDRMRSLQMMDNHMLRDNGEDDMLLNMAREKLFRR